MGILEKWVVMKNGWILEWFFAVSIFLSLYILLFMNVHVGALFLGAILLFLIPELGSIILVVVAVKLLFPEI